MQLKFSPLRFSCYSFFHFSGNILTLSALKIYSFSHEYENFCCKKKEVIYNGLKKREKNVECIP